MEIDRNQQKKKKRGKKTGKINKTPAVGNDVGASSLEIRTRNCSLKSITLWTPLNHFGGIEPKTTKLSVSQCVPSKSLCNPRVGQKKSALKIAINCVSDWLKSATTWRVSMGLLRQ